MGEALAAMTESRRKTILENIAKGESGDFTDAEGRLRLGHLHVLKQYESLYSHRVRIRWRLA